MHPVIDKGARASWMMSCERISDDAYAAGRRSVSELLVSRQKGRTSVRSTARPKVRSWTIVLKNLLPTASRPRRGKSAS